MYDKQETKFDALVVGGKVETENLVFGDPLSSQFFEISGWVYGVPARASFLDVPFLNFLHCVSVNLVKRLNDGL